nr:TonB-dependent receptor [Desulfonema magnum]
MLFIVTTQGIAADAPKTGEQPEAVSETADAPKIAEQPKAATLEEITVHGERLKDNIKITPGAIVINPEDYKKAGTPHTVLDILKDRAIFDFRGASDLSPTNDDVQMRGFDTRQFTTAVDGLAIQKLGGHWGGHFVDYSLIPMEQIGSIEILPGPHSALYEGKSFGGVLNIKTKAPVRRETPEAKFNATTSYASLGTSDISMKMSGGSGSMDYVLGFREYHTDGYLKNNDNDLSTVSARMAWLLPNNGYMSLLGSYTDKTEGITCENDPDGNFYDDAYPVVERGDVSGRWRDPDLNARREKKPYSIRFNWQQPSGIGRWTVGAYYTYEDQEFETDSGLLAETEWSSLGAKIHNEFRLTDNHLVTVGMDAAGLGNDTSKAIVRTLAGFIQDCWYITPHLSFTPGLRYEKIRILWNNENFRSGGYANPDIQELYVTRHYDKLMPKAFATYDLDGLAGFLRDTSVSVGLSKVWTPRATCEV